MIDYFPGKRKISEITCFVHNGGYYLTTLSVYEGGGIECWGKMNKQEFIEKVRSGWITVDLPDNVEVRIGNQGFIFKQAETLGKDGNLMFKHKWITNESFVMDVLDSVDVSIGNKSASKLCSIAYDNYCDNKTEINKNKLRTAYLNVPEHNRGFILGDQDLKDFPIKSILDEK